MKKPKRVGEPVQVYLDTTERRRLDRLTQELGKTKSDVVRQALQALERQALDPDAHPALRIIGLADRERAGGPGYDVAREHDRYLADSEEASWGRRPPRKRRRRAR